jgi:ATP-dependent HslUV protease ATP-binding subunit HslU
MVEYLLDEISFTAPERKDEKIAIGEEMVRDRLTPLIGDSDVRRYLL